MTDTIDPARERVKQAFAECPLTPGTRILGAPPTAEARNALQLAANLYGKSDMGLVLQALLDLDWANDPTGFDQDAVDLAIHEVRGLTEDLIGEAELTAASNRDIGLNYGSRNDD